LSIMEKPSVIVFGAGSWGTALAATLAERGLPVQFWGRDAGLMSQLASTRLCQRYVAGLRLLESIHITSDMTELRPADILMFVVPSKAMDSTAAMVAALPLARQARAVVTCTKGIEQGSGARMSQILARHFPELDLAALTGPNHAEEVAQRMATAAVIASPNEALARELQDCFRLPWFRCYTTDDLVGVEWAGAMKNPYAIAAGIAEGLNLGDNAIAALVTRALAEMTRLGQAMGGRTETFFGLSGVGDLVGTCYSRHSRNHRLGLAIGQGQSWRDQQGQTNMIAEGVPNTLSLHEVAQKAGVSTPLLDAVYSVLYQDKSPALALRELLDREPKSERG
jgi:glycerol-3-phosphate dehydrogenase (NAD(P)+)